MREIELKSFDNLEDALFWMENMIEELFYDRDHEDIKGEISLIDGTWRVGIITGSRQLEMEI